MGYGCAGGGTGEGGTSDHRLLTGRTDANQHPAAAISVETEALPGELAEARNVQAALALMAGQTTTKEIHPDSAVAIGAFRAVALRDDGRVEPADHTRPEHDGRVAGLTLASVAAGGAARVCVEGPIQFNGWNWRPGLSVFVMRNGELSQTPPEAGCIQSIGIALGLDRLLVRIERPISRR